MITSVSWYILKDTMSISVDTGVKESPTEKLNFEVCTCGVGVLNVREII